MALHSSSRRGFVTAAIASTVAPAALATRPGPHRAPPPLSVDDAALIAAYRDVEALEVALAAHPACRLTGIDRAMEADYDALLGRSCDRLWDMADLAAGDRTALHAKARALLVAIGTKERPESDLPGALAWSLCEDLLRDGGAA